MVLAANCAKFSQFVACFAILYPIGIGLCYLTPLACGWEWVPERKGLVTGVILGAFGFGAFVFSLIAQAVVNPENVRAEELVDGRLIYSPEIASRVPKLMYVLAASFGGLGALATMLVRRNPTFVEQVKVSAIDKELSVCEALGERQFYLLCLMDFLTIFPLAYLA